VENDEKLVLDRDERKGVCDAVTSLIVVPCNARKRGDAKKNRIT